MLSKQKQFWQTEFQVCFELKNGAPVQFDTDGANRKYKKVAQLKLCLECQMSNFEVDSFLHR